MKSPRELCNVTAPARQAGRPVEPVPPVIADALIAWVAEGKTLRSFSRQPSSPSWRTIYDWLRKDADLRERMKLAREIGFDALAEECLEIADQEGPSGGPGPAFVQHQRLRIETRLKLLARWSPQRYGNRVGIDVPRDHSRTLTHMERLHRLQAIFQAAGQRTSISAKLLRVDAPPTAT